MLNVVPYASITLQRTYLPTFFFLVSDLAITLPTRGGLIIDVEYAAVLSTCDCINDAQDLY